MLALILSIAALLLAGTALFLVLREPEEPEIPPEIPEEEPPLVEVPEEEIIDEEPPLVEIPEEEVPLDSTPRTGDARRTGLWAALCGVSLCGMTALLGKKKDEEA